MREKNSEQLQNKKTIGKVRAPRGGGCRRGMVKDHTFALFNFGTLPLVYYKVGETNEGESQRQNPGIFRPALNHLVV